MINTLLIQETDAINELYNRPVTLLGKIIGSICSLTGIIMLALPISVLSSTFVSYRKNENRNQQFLAKFKKSRQNKERNFVEEHAF
jgi:hypothetical protein